MPRADDPAYPAMAAELQALFAATATDGRVIMPLVTRVYLGHLPGPASG